MNTKSTISRLEDIKKMNEHIIKLNKAELIKLIQQENLDYNAIHSKLMETFGAKQRIVQTNYLITDLKQLEAWGSKEANYGKKE